MSEEYVCKYCKKSYPLNMVIKKEKIEDGMVIEEYVCFRHEKNEGGN